MIHFILKTIIFFSFMSTHLLAQEESESTVDQRVGWETKAIPYDHKNVMVPRALWEKMKATLRTQGVSEKTMDEFSIHPITVEVEVRSTEKNVLKGDLNYQLIYSEGGGVVDFFDYVTGRGSFFIRLLPQLDGSRPIHMLYVSESPQKEVKSEVWGNGCGKIYNLTDQAGLFLDDKGIRVTSSKKHYLHLMAGIYVFFQFEDDKLSLGYIRVTDSRYPQFKCQD